MTKIDMTAANQLPKHSEELLKVFSRFEYALKEIGYVAPGARNDEVRVLWDRFANELLGSKFFQQINNQGIAPTLLSKPPNMQVVNDQKWGWKEVDPPNNIQELFGAVRRVRNNLFHGGKSGDPDADRNATLVYEALAVLIEALNACEDIRYPFENRW